jgi:pseudouridylate synthase / pseudouridine kinase
MYQHTRKMAFFESPEWWEAINSLEMSSAGSRDRLVSITNADLVDKGIPQQTIQLLPYIPNLVVKLGAQGCLLTYLLPQGDPALSAPEAAPYILGRATSDRSVIGGVYMRLFPAAEAVRQEEIVSVNGVGDTMLGVLMAGLVQDAARLEELIPVAQQGAVRTLKSAAAVSPEVQGLRGLVGSAHDVQMKN